MLIVKDIMVKDVVSVKRDTPIYEAMEVMAQNKIAGIPVVDDDNAVVGILSEKDVLSLLFYAHGDEEEKTVNDFMTQPPVYFEEDENLLGACDCLINHSFRRVPITSQGKLVGIISRADIIECILHLRHENADISAEQPS